MSVDTYWIAKAREVYRTIDAFGWRIDWPHDKAVPDDAWPIDIIATALREASETKADEIERLRAELAAHPIGVAEKYGRLQP